MIVFLVFCIIDLIINIIQAIIAAIVTALVGILESAKDAGNCKEYNGKCYCTFTDDATAIKDTLHESRKALIYLDINYSCKSPEEEDIVYI